MHVKVSAAKCQQLCSIKGAGAVLLKCRTSMLDRCCTTAAGVLLLLLLQGLGLCCCWHCCCKNWACAAAPGLGLVQLLALLLQDSGLCCWHCCRRTHPSS